MKDIKIKIRPYNQSNKKDKVRARVLEELANKEREKYDGVMAEISKIQILLEKVYGITLDVGYWNSLFNEVIKLNLRNNIERDLK